MVHDPKILILDEPTVGLDPIQIREVRYLIRELGDRHTILLSTHIMPEVEAVCARVIIIAGQIALDDQIDRIRVEGRHCRSQWPGRADPRPPADDRWRADRDDHGAGPGDRSIRDPDPRRQGGAPEHLSAAHLQGWPLGTLEIRKGSLEERFVAAVTRENPAQSRREAV